VAKQPSRPVANKNDLDLIPPEELRARRLKRILFLAIPVIAAVGVGMYFAAPPISGAIKAWQSRRLAREALALIDQKKWREADAKARDAYLLRPSEPEAQRAIARLLSRAGQSGKALEWWKKLDEERRLTVEDRRNFAASALAAGELPMAAAQIDVLLAQQGGPAPIDILLAGQLAARRSDGVLTVDYAERVMADKRARPYDILSAAILVLSVTTRDSRPHINAWKHIENLAREPKNPASLDALVFLAQQQSLAPLNTTQSDTASSLSVPATQQSLAPLTGNNSLSLGPTNTTSPNTTTMELLEIADALEKHPSARPYQQLLALQLRAQHDPALADQYVADAVERFGKGDDETLAALGAWLNSIGRFAKTLDVLPQARALQRQDLFLQHINALTALQHWNEIKDLLSSEHSVVDPVVQHMYLAVAQAHLGSATAAANEWKRALESANTPEKFQAVASYAEQNGANDIADEAYSEAIKIEPKNRTAHAGRLRLALAEGQTAQAQTIAAEIAQLWPDDAAARNQDAYLRLLLGATDGGAEAAEQQAQVLVAQEPSNWSARATLGLARLRLGKKKDALAAIREPRVTGGEPPGALAVRAAILAANGYEEGARNDAHLLGVQPLLPEERALIAPLIAVGN
jgi:Tfp pilus assembly protein PilF